MVEVIEKDGKRYASIDGMKEALHNDQLMLECAVMLKIGREKGHEIESCMRHCVGNFLVTVTGKMPLLNEGIQVDGRN